MNTVSTKRFWVLFFTCSFGRLIGEMILRRGFSGEDFNERILGVWWIGKG